MEYRRSLIFYLLIVSASYTGCAEEPVPTLMKHVEPSEAAMLALSFYRDVIGQLNEEMIDSLIAEDYIQHNPMVKTGRAGFKEAFAYLKQMPRPENPKSPVVRFIAEGDLAVLHLDVEIAGRKQAVIDLFRVENGQLAEHWDVMQVQPDTTASGRGMTDGAITIKDLEKTASNKALVEDYYKTVWLAGSWGRLAAYVDANVIQHNPLLADGLEAVATAGESHVKIAKVHRLIAEGNFVVAQLEGVAGEVPHAIYEIHRLTDGRIVEQWRVQQAIPEQMAHQNGMF